MKMVLYLCLWALMNKQFKISTDNFIIKNKTFNSKNNSYSYVCALTDGIKVVIVNLDNKGFIKEISDINIVDDVSITNILLYKKQERTSQRLER